MKFAAGLLVLAGPRTFENSRSLYEVVKLLQSIVTQKKLKKECPGTRELDRFFVNGKTRIIDLSRWSKSFFNIQFMVNFGIKFKPRFESRDFHAEIEREEIEVLALDGAHELDSAPL